jgi:lipopolysaccharide transport system ATP-binding protein
VFYEFEATDDLGIPVAGVEIHDAADQVVHGKSTIENATEVPESVSAGARLQFHQVIELKLAPGRYSLEVGFASCDSTRYREYLARQIPYAAFARSLQEHCRCRLPTELTVTLDPTGQLAHHGLVDLAGSCDLIVGADNDPGPTRMRLESTDRHSPAQTTPEQTLVHVTHQKAGSQWIHRILRACFSERIVDPVLGDRQFKNRPIANGAIYPTVYVTRDEFEAVHLPPGTRHFTVIRDLRDTLISAYFSLKLSHPIDDANTAQIRRRLCSVSLEEGLLYLMDSWLVRCARIQLSWLEAGETVIRYEDLLDDDLAILERTLIDQLAMPVSRDSLREAVAANRFEIVTGGRKPGCEDITAHERKGVAGDWRNYFNERLKRAFKSRFGGVLVLSKYENDLSW